MSPNDGITKKSEIRSNFNDAIYFFFYSIFQYEQRSKYQTTGTMALIIKL
jgi:hypothetical protein